MPGPGVSLPVAVIGLDGGPLPEAARTALASARLVVGGARHLDAAAGAVPPGTQRVALGPLAPALDRLRTCLESEGGPAVVLASGDPGFFGIVRRLRAEGLDPAVIPAVSSIAAAFARAGLPWDGAAVVSAHGRDLGPALNACRALPLVAVLTEAGAGPAEIGAGLDGWDRRLLVAQALGTDGERVVEVSPSAAAEQTWAQPNVVLCVAPGALDDAGARADNQPAAAPVRGWARPESDYAHRDSMITKAEIRALVVARLRPRLGRLIWDVGAGSGSVGIECATLGAAVIAVEADPAGCELVAANARAHGTAAAVRVVQGAAPEALAGLPAPDAVFVGGGGLAVVEAAARAGAERVVVTLAALDRVSPVMCLLRDAGYAAEGCQLAASRLSGLPGGATRLVAMNPVIVVTGEQP